MCNERISYVYLGVKIPPSNIGKPNFTKGTISLITRHRRMIAINTNYHINLLIENANGCDV